MEGKILIGTATCGVASGALKTLEKLNKLDKKTAIVEVGCIGSCYLEPIIAYQIKDETYFYQKISEDKVEKLLELLKNKKYDDKSKNPYFFAKKSELNKHEFFKIQTKRVTKNCGLINSESLEEYKKVGGFKPLADAMKQTPEQVIETVKASGLRGRGGAGFPTGQKWEIISKKTGPKYLVCNADEGDPGAFMNRSLMEGDPFRIIEGMMIASYAINATKGIIYVRAEKPLAAKRMQNAVKQLQKNKLLGDKAKNSRYSFDIEVRLGAGAFVCGEETALINSIMGERGMPRLKPPYPSDFGIDGIPTNVNNVETFAQVTTLYEIGLQEFTKLGTEKSKGTKTFALTGKLRHQGMIEVPLGTSLKDIIFGAGGGTEKPFKTAQIGGPSGGCIPLSEIDVALDYESLRAKGTHMGSGGIVILDEDDSMITLSRFFLSFTQQESCGKCTPCREGTRRMLEIMTKIEDGKAKQQDFDNLFELANIIQDTALCGLGQAAPNPVLSTMRYFKDEYDAYLKRSFRFEVGEGCIDCKKCIVSCPVKTIIEDEKKKVAFIIQDKCVHCGVCEKVCPTHAILKKPVLKK